MPPLDEGDTQRQTAESQNNAAEMAHREELTPAALPNQIWPDGEVEQDRPGWAFQQSRQAKEEADGKPGSRRLSFGTFPAPPNTQGSRDQEAESRIDFPERSLVEQRCGREDEQSR